MKLSVFVYSIIANIAAWFIASLIEYFFGNIGLSNNINPVYVILFILFFSLLAVGIYDLLKKEYEYSIRYYLFFCISFVLMLPFSLLYVNYINKAIEINILLFYNISVFGAIISGYCYVYKSINKNYNKANLQIGDHKVIITNNKYIKIYKLQTSDNFGKLELTWDTFGYGIHHLMRTIKDAGGLYPDIVFGVNEAGIIVASYLSMKLGDRVHLGIIKTGGVGMDGNRSYVQFEFPDPQVELPDTEIISQNVNKPGCIFLVDSEIESGRSIKGIRDILKWKYPGAKIVNVSLVGVLLEPKEDIVTIKDFANKVDDEYRPDFLAFYSIKTGFEPPGGIR